MATILPDSITSIGIGDGATVQVQWTPVTEADSCAAIAYPEWTDRSVQAAGTFGSGSVAVQGSNDGTNFASLHDPGGTAIAITSAGVKQILENTYQVKPGFSGGSSQSLTVTMILRLNNPLRQ